MIKIPCLFQRDFGPGGPGGPRNNAGKEKPVLLRAVTPGCEWVLFGEGIATQKVDGTACLVKDGKLYARFDVKIDPRTGERKKMPEGTLIPCTSEPDPVTGHWPHWILVTDQPQYKYHRNAARNYVMRFGGELTNGTYEACGPHFQGNPEKLKVDSLLRHGTCEFPGCPRTFDGIRDFLVKLDIEGIVFYRDPKRGTDGEMCKIRKADYGLPRKPA